MKWHDVKRHSFRLVLSSAVAILILFRLFVHQP